MSLKLVMDQEKMQSIFNSYSTLDRHRFSGRKYQGVEINTSEGTRQNASVTLRIRSAYELIFLVQYSISFIPA